MRKETKYIKRVLKCIDNTNSENRFTIGKEYLSLYDYLDSLYCLVNDDLGGHRVIADKHLFIEVSK